MTKKYKEVTLWLTPEQHQVLREISFRKNVSMSDLVRNAINLYTSEIPKADGGQK